MAVLDTSSKFCTLCGHVLLDRRTGRPASELFDLELLEKSNILRLRECSGECGVADRYVEADGTLVLIDLVLGSKPAYRHVLLNGGTQYGRLISKMALLAVICDGYIGWNASCQGNGGEFFEQEYQFYGFCGRALMGLAAFMLIALACGVLKQSQQCVAGQMWVSALGLLMAYASRFLNLAALFWTSKESESGFVGEWLMWAFIYLLFYVASVRALQVTQRLSLLSSLVLSCLAHAGYLFAWNFDTIINPYECSKV